MRILLLLLIMLQAGCSLIVPKTRVIEPVPPVIIESSIQLHELMGYFTQLQLKTKLELAWEYNYARSHYLNSNDPQEKFKFLMLLVQADTKYFNIKAAADHLEQITNSHTLSSDLSVFSAILGTLLQQQIDAKKEIQELTAQLNASREQIVILQRRIDAIKSIERNLIRRNGSDAN